MEQQQQQQQNLPKPNPNPNPNPSPNPNPNPKCVVLPDAYTFASLIGACAKSYPPDPAVTLTLTLKP